MSSEAKRSRLPWVVVGIAVIAILLLALSPHSLRADLVNSVKAFILRVHGAVRPKP